RPEQLRNGSDRAAVQGHDPVAGSQDALGGHAGQGPKHLHAQEDLLDRPSRVAGGGDDGALLREQHPLPLPQAVCIRAFPGLQQLLPGHQTASGNHPGKEALKRACFADAHRGEQKPALLAKISPGHVDELQDGNRRAGAKHEIGSRYKPGGRHDEQDSKPKNSPSSAVHPDFTLSGRPSPPIDRRISSSLARAASSPRRMHTSTRVNAVGLMSDRSGWRATSAVKSCGWVICLSITSKDWAITSKIFRILSPPAGGITSTAITTSAPISLTTETDTRSMTPPSTRVRPSHSTGSKIPGIDTLARTARSTGPVVKTTRSPLVKSVAITDVGMRRSSRFFPWVRSRTSSRIRLPVINPRRGRVKSSHWFRFR